jgi:acetylornithine deacetylase/succinyl-diaminopimelate desuccinylase-like protein
MHPEYCGSLAVAHRPNEWIPPDDLTTAIELTETLVRACTMPPQLA